MTGIYKPFVLSKNQKNWRNRQILKFPRVPGGDKRNMSKQAGEDGRISWNFINLALIAMSSLKMCRK